MIELYTSFWKNPELGEVDAQMVSISRGDKSAVPFRYRKIWSLAPSRETFALQDAGEYEESYLGDLEAVGVEQIMDKLEQISAEHSGKPLVLLCHERDPAECHRSMFARWYEGRTGQRISELTPGDLPDAADVAQPRLL